MITDDLKGAIYAPGVDLPFHDNNHFTGVIAGATTSGSISFNNNGNDVTYDPTAGSSCPYYSSTMWGGGGSGGNVALNSWQE